MLGFPVRSASNLRKVIVFKRKNQACVMHSRENVEATRPVGADCQPAKAWIRDASKDPMS